MLRTFIAASVLVLAAGATQAEDYPVLQGSGDNAVVEYGNARPGSVAGGATVRWSGSGDDTSFAYGPVQAQPGRIARLQGSREDAEVVYEPAPVAPRLLAGTRGQRTGG